MLLNAKKIHGFILHCLDGEIGTVNDILFDDLRWTVRYLVIDTGSWLTGRQVLISPHAITGVDEAGRRILVKLTRKQIEDSPPLDSDRPVSLQFEELYHGYYQWPLYWASPLLWEPVPAPADSKAIRDAADQRKARDDHHLRSVRHVSGYTLMAEDGEVGAVGDFILETGTWSIEYLLITTGNWWSGRNVLIAPRWAESINWLESKVFVRLSRAVIKESPALTSGSPITRDYETRLHKHYRRQGYWTEVLES